MQKTNLITATKTKEITKDIKITAPEGARYLTD